MGVKERKVLDMALSKKQLHDNLRARYMEMLRKTLEEAGEEILVTASNELSVPCLDEAGNEEWLVLTFKVPTGSRDGEAYDGYTAAQMYAEKVADREAKAKESAEAKARKIAKDKAEREAKAKAKADREASKGQ